VVQFRQFWLSLQSVDDNQLVLGRYAGFVTSAAFVLLKNVGKRHPCPAQRPAYLVDEHDRKFDRRFHGLIVSLDDIV
jgi:hypothetical protein